MLLLRNKDQSRTTHPQVSQPVFASKVAHMIEFQAHHHITPEQWTWLLWSVSFIPAINSHCKNPIN